MTQQAPVVSLGSSAVTAPVVRGGLQVSAGAFLVQGLQLFNLADLNSEQATWLTVALTVTLSLAQNVVESWRGRQFLGRAPAPAVDPPD